MVTKKVGFTTDEMEEEEVSETGDLLSATSSGTGYASSSVSTTKAVFHGYEQASKDIVQTWQASMANVAEMTAKLTPDDDNGIPGNDDDVEDDESESKSPAETDKSEKDSEVKKALIAISELKWPGMNEDKLIAGAVHLNAKSGTFWQSHKHHSNEDQINYAKYLWNVVDVETRKTFLPCDTKWFIDMASDPGITNILTDAFERFNASIKSGGGNAAAYFEIKSKYEQAKRIQQNESPFTQQLTPGQQRLIAKFEARARVERVKYDEHKPNENAVTYAYLLGKLIYLLGLPLATKEEKQTSRNICKDVLMIVGIHGTKSVSYFQKVVNKYDEINGPNSKINIKPGLINLMRSDQFVTANSSDVSNKYLSNKMITLKRLVRLSYICTSEPTVWGMMGTRDEVFKDNLKQLHALEKKVDSPDMNSLAIVWYLCIGRANINAVAVDHWEASAGNILATLVNKARRNEITPPDYVFPWDKEPSSKFTFSK